METKDLYQDWVLDLSTIKGWHASNLKILSFKENNMLCLIDIRSNIIEEKQFKVKDDNTIILDEERVFGQIVTLTENSLEIKHSQGVNVSYKKLPQTTIELQDVKLSIEDWITTNKWESDLIKNKRVRLQKEKKDVPFQYQMLKEGGQMVVNFESELTQYNGYWSILYKIDFAGHQGDESIFLESISKNQLIIKLDESPFQIILNREV